MKIAICASEGAPYVKSGGLGDVMEALPSALARIAGNEVVLFLPYYNKIKTNTAYMVERVAEIRVQLGWRQQYCGIMKLTNRNDGVQVYFLDNDYYFGARTGAIYGDMDDGERFAFFSRGCLDAMIALNFIPEIIQCNDWQTACIPIYLKAMYHGTFYKTRCMYTIHNIEYQGWANAGFFDDVLGLPWEYRSTLDMSNSVNVMKGAIETADLVTTVSETYARELMYPYYAHGLDSVLAGNAWKLTGITNGIDVNTFNPETDPALPAHYNSETFVEGKAAVKAALQKEVGLPVKPDVPLMVMVTRLAGHKGLDLLCYIARRLMWEEDAQLLILGTGEAQYESFFKDLCESVPRSGFRPDHLQSGACRPDLRRRRHLPDALQVRALRPEPDERHALRHRPRGSRHRRPEGHRSSRRRERRGWSWLHLPELQRRRFLRVAEALPRPVQSQPGSLPRPAEAGHGDGFQLGCPRRTVHGAVPEYAELVKYSK